MRARVCIVTSAHPVSDPRVVLKQAYSIRNAGYPVTLLAQVDGKVDLANIEVVGFRKPKSRIWRMLSISYQMIRTAIKLNADIYHMHDPELLPWSIVIKKIRRKVIVFDFHENFKKDVSNRYYLPPAVQKGVKIIYGIIEKLSLKFVDYIILAEDSYARDYNYANASVIHNYPILRSMHSITRGNDNNCSTLNIAIVGQISLFRGYVEALKALAQLVNEGYKNIRLRFIGAFENDEVKSDFLELVTALQLGNFVDTHGQVSHDEVFQLLHESDLGLSLLHPIPNYIESFPTKIFEYYLSGMPVISSNFKYLEDVVTAENCGKMIDPTSVDSIVDAMKYFSDNPKEMKTMGENGRRMVLSKYNWAREEVKLISIYNSLTDKYL